MRASKKRTRNRSRLDVFLDNTLLKGDGKALHSRMTAVSRNLNINLKVGVAGDRRFLVCKDTSTPGCQYLVSLLKLSIGIQDCHFSLFEQHTTSSEGIRVGNQKHSSLLSNMQCMKTRQVSLDSIGSCFPYIRLYHCWLSYLSIPKIRPLVIDSPSPKTGLLKLFLMQSIKF